MNPFAIVVLLGSLVLSYLMFQAVSGSGWHWAWLIVLAALPVVATLFFGMLGFIGSAMITGAVYKVAS